ncbi:MAG: nucleoside hydrolase [Anaerolineae bacterium]|nr:nucleoside hydrolase [Anaerolineae bacterium]
MPTQNIIIDCDTGVDDALALLVALRAPRCNVLGITCVGGNVPLAKVVRNTLVMGEHAHRNVPTYQGAARPLLAPPVTAEYAHGSDGLGDIGFPEPQRSPAKEHAVDFLIRSYMETPDELPRELPLLLTLAPLTNIALALLREPQLEERIPHIVMMAGGITGGNTTAAAEFNVYVDPEAADIVFRSRIPKTMVSLEPIRDGAILNETEVAQIETGPGPWCWAMGRLLRKNLTRWEELSGRPHPISPPDLAAAAVALEPGMATVEQRHVAIETRGEHTRGMTLVDNRQFRHLASDAMPPNVAVVTAINTARFQALVLDAMLGNS